MRLHLLLLFTPLVLASPPAELVERAGQGDISSQISLAEYYAHPDHYAPHNMLTWYMKAAQAGSARAQAMVGYLLLEGIGAPSHPPTAMPWLELAAEQSDTESQLLLASIYLNGSHGIPANHALAFHYFSQAAKAKHPQAQLMLAICLEHGIGCKPDSSLALLYAQKAAAQNNAQALTFLGDLAQKSVPHGTKNHLPTAKPPLSPTARAYYMHAAFLQHAKANYELALDALRESGNTRFSDSREKQEAIFSLFEDAATDGYAPAMYELALCYLWGYGVEPDARYAAKLAADASAHGYHAASYLVSYLLTQGLGAGHHLFYEERDDIN